MGVAKDESSSSAFTLVQGQSPLSCLSEKLFPRLKTEQKQQLQIN